MTRLEVLIERLKVCDIKINKVYERRKHIEEQISRLKRVEILTKKLLRGEWKLQVWGTDNRFNLVADEDNFSKLIKILDPSREGYYPSLCLNNIVEVSYNDSELFINFGDYSFEEITNFIDKQGIIIDAKTVSERLDKMKKRVLIIENIYNQFKSSEEI